MTWAAVLLTAAGCYLLKLAGLSVPPRVLDRPAVRRSAALLPVALLAALVAVQTVATGNHLVVDARLAGMAVAVVALILRAPFIVVVVLATLATALVRMVV
jgi:Branched-chain amino acid transport protein (AzlD)